VIGPDLDSFSDLGYGNFGGARKNFFQRAVVTGIEMLQKDKSMPVVSGNWPNRAEKASRPPAEATDRTTGKTLSSVEPDAGEVTGGEDAYCVLELNAFSQDRPRSGRTQEEYCRTLSLGAEALRSKGRY